jgi:uncharacterized protein (TIGR02145 family)
MNTVDVLNQTWLLDNLATTTFMNGDTIFFAKSASDWRAAGIAKMPACCYYWDEIKNGELFGLLYNWYAVIDPRGIAPDGFRIPSNQDWETLAINLAKIGNVYKEPEVKDTQKKNFFATMIQKIKDYNTDNLWGLGEERCGFEMCLGGYRLDDGTPSSSHFLESSFWTKTEHTIDKAISYSIERTYISRSYEHKNYGFYVKCIAE